MTKTEKTQVKRMQVKKLTPSELGKITGGGGGVRDCTGPSQPTCIAYIIVKDPLP